MKTFIASILLALAACGSGKPARLTSTSSSTAPAATSSTSSAGASGGNSTSSGGVSVSPKCFKPNGVPVGWLPDGVDIMTVENKVKAGTYPCYYGQYAQITSSSYGDSQMDYTASQASSSDAVYVVSLQPWIPFNQVNVQTIAKSMETILSKGPSVVWLRFAHEMNWYTSTNTLNHDTPYVGSTADFKALWQNIAKTVDRSKVKMFWSPNSPVYPDTVASIGTSWWPGAEYVDVVGMDAYPQKEQTFADVFGDFYDTYAKPNNLPFALGETGWFQGGTDEQKKYWLTQVSSAAALQRCPNYLGFAWFEYDKPSEGDFRVVMGSSDIAAQVLG